MMPSQPLTEDDFFVDRDFTYYTLRVMTVLGVVLLAIFIWAATPWFPWK